MTSSKIESSVEKNKVCFNDSMDLYGTTIWIATLSDGSEVFQDDYDDAEIGSAWIRLGNFLRQSKLQIVGLRLRFRSHVEALESNCDGYYFAKGVVAAMGSDITVQQYIAGTLKDGYINVSHWRVPELISEMSGTRELDECGPRLIKNESEAKCEKAL